MIKRILLFVSLVPIVLLGWPALVQAQASCYQRPGDEVRCTQSSLYVMPNIYRAFAIWTGIPGPASSISDLIAFNTNTTGPEINTVNIDGPGPVQRSEDQPRYSKVTLGGGPITLMGAAPVGSMDGVSLYVNPLYLTRPDAPGVPVGRMSSVYIAALYLGAGGNIGHRPALVTEGAMVVGDLDLTVQYAPPPVGTGAARVGRLWLNARDKQLCIAFAREQWSCTTLQ